MVESDIKLNGIEEKPFAKVGRVLIKVLLGICIALFILTFAIAVPILFRPFYYWNVKWLDLVEETGYSEEQIKNSYNEVMDYLLFGGEFSVGDLPPARGEDVPFSEEGKAHFEDCRKLFVLNFVVLGVSAAFVAIVIVLVKTKKLDLKCGKFTPAFFSIVGLLSFFAIVGIWGMIDFNGLFVAFHMVAFPGKDNWQFGPQDPIINILPLELWLNFGILIVAVFVLLLTAVLVFEFRRRKKLFACH